MIIMMMIIITTWVPGGHDAIIAILPNKQAWNSWRRSHIINSHWNAFDAFLYQTWYWCLSYACACPVKHSVCLHMKVNTFTHLFIKKLPARKNDLITTANSMYKPANCLPWNGCLNQSHIRIQEPWIWIPNLTATTIWVVGPDVSSKGPHHNPLIALWTIQLTKKQPNLA